ncbi:MAG TPA: DinB family protein [Terriglobales bacterium]|nr:DinB family protein [Terriglobales bacterium]
MQMLDRLEQLIAVAPLALESKPPAEAARRPQAGKWSPQEELGHLIDSAVNNYGRIIRAQREDNPALPGYEQDAWVERQDYQGRDWAELIALWAAMNRHLLHAARRVPAAALARRCSVGKTGMTLEFLIEDYVDHVVHHLQHIGVDVRQFRRAQSAYS